MKCRIFYSLVILLSASHAIAQNGKSSLLNTNLQSNILKKQVSYSVYLPEGYSAADSDKKYPVLYLLHGYGGSNLGWINEGKINDVADNMIQTKSIEPVILVIPDAGTSWYINGIEDNYEEFFIKEFIPYIESTYKCNAAKNTRAIAGISMGGYGALLYSLKYPELFSVCCILSPAILTDIDVKYMPDQTYQMFKGSFGERTSQLWKDNNVLEIIRTIELGKDSLPLFYMDCGDNDFLYRGNANLHIYMRDKKINHRAIMRHGEHNWDYWTPALPEILKFTSLNVKQ